MKRLPGMLLAAVLANVIVFSIAFALGAFGEESYTPEATRCGRDISAMYQFWQAKIANTPDPQTTLETGLHLNVNTGQQETYAQLLHRIAYYAELHC